MSRLLSVGRELFRALTARAIAACPLADAHALEPRAHSRVRPSAHSESPRRQESDPLCLLGERKSFPSEMRIGVGRVRRRPKSWFAAWVCGRLLQLQSEEMDSDLGSLRHHEEHAVEGDPAARAGLETPERWPQNLCREQRVRAENRARVTLPRGALGSRLRTWPSTVRDWLGRYGTWRHARRDAPVQSTQGSTRPRTPGRAMQGLPSVPGEL